MNDPQADAIRRIKAAGKLLSGPTTTIEKFNIVKDLVSGLDPRIDKIINRIDGSLINFNYLAEGDVINLSASLLPEGTDEEKKRKKWLIFFIRNWRLLAKETARIGKELESRSRSTSNKNTLKAVKIVSTAKGPFGLVTLAALVIVASWIIFQPAKKQDLKKLDTSTVSVTPTTGQTLKAIIYKSKQIPLIQLFVGHGPDCDSPHYHALNEISVTATDGTVFPDPGGCGYGRVSQVETVNLQ